MSANRVNNTFFTSITELTNKNKMQDTDTRPLVDIQQKCLSSLFAFKHVSAAQIRKTVDLLPSQASTGNDNISTAMLKNSPMAIMQALELIFNASISSGILSDKSKHAIITPIYKRGDIYDLGTYRPISLLPIISKVFEKRINEQLGEYLSSNTIINDAQHFQQNCSYQAALLQLWKTLFTLKSAKMCTFFTTLDF